MVHKIVNVCSLAENALINGATDISVPYFSPMHFGWMNLPPWQGGEERQNLIWAPVGSGASWFIKPLQPSCWVSSLSVSGQGADLLACWQPGGGKEYQ